MQVGHKPSKQLAAANLELGFPVVVGAHGQPYRAECTAADEYGMVVGVDRRP